MTEIIRSSTFSAWLAALADSRARARIQARIDRMADRNMGDAKPVGDGLSEARIDYGPGYRVYFMQQGQQLVVLLCGGDKSSQARDIKQAKQIAKAWKEQNPGPNNTGAGIPPSTSRPKRTSPTTLTPAWQKRATIQLLSPRRLEQSPEHAA